MKRLLFILTALCTSIVMMAGNGDSYFSIKAGFLFPKTFNGEISYQHALDYDTSIELFGELGKKIVDSHQAEDYYWAGGLAYHKGMKRYKNAELKLLGECHAGAHIRRIFFGFGIGLEYAYTCSNGLQIVLQQKNQVNFLRNDTFKNGIMVGVRYPI